MCRCACSTWASIPLRCPSFTFPFCFSPSFFTSFLHPLDTWQRKHGCFPFSAACLSPELLNDFFLLPAADSRKLLPLSASGESVCNFSHKCTEEGERLPLRERVDGARRKWAGSGESVSKGLDGGHSWNYPPVMYDSDEWTKKSIRI